MSRDLLTDVGENYEYLRTIIINKFELKKLELLELGSKLASNIVLVLLICTIALFTCFWLLVALTLWMIQVTGSPIGGVLIVSGILLLTGILLYIFRRGLIQEPVLKGFYRNLEKYIK